MSESGDSHPVSADSIEEWCRNRHIPPHEGRQRFMEFVILVCISRDTKLSAGLVFKGGNALRFVYQNPRSTVDLDFTVATGDIPDSADGLRGLFDTALLWAHRRFYVKAKCQRVKRNPQKSTATRPTYRVNIGYQLPSDVYFNSFEDRNVSTVVPLEISFADLVCEDQCYFPEEHSEPAVRVCTLEDIVAEKLRALLQQPIRNRYRWQDVFDIARIYREFGTTLDLGKIADFFNRKCKVRDITPRRSSFDDEIRERAEYEYEERLKQQAASHLIPFAEAWKLVNELVDLLELPT